jgi:hypothetical protein
VGVCVISCLGGVTDNNESGSVEVYKTEKKSSQGLLLMKIRSSG